VKRLFFYALMASQLWACASMETSKNVVDPTLVAGNDAKVLVLKEWRLLGRLSARNGKESWLTKLEWKHNIWVDDLTFSTSLGGVVATLAYAGNTIIFAASDGVKREVTEQELQAKIGYSPPLQHLKFWVRGVPNPTLSFQKIENNLVGVRAFHQGGWRVELGRFELLDDVVLPAKVMLSRNDLTMKIVVDQWLK